jgi:hypothetical protein
MVEIQAEPAVPPSIVEKLSAPLRRILEALPGLYHVDIYTVGRWEDEFVLRVTTPSGGRLPFLIARRKPLEPENLVTRVKDAIRRVGA